ncbi:Mitochondrial enolase superfamily member 1 [Halotydeus destructor]|nr:Mitochondrial enolase superfamily member 1 [Halotydeus destructor]
MEGTISELVVKDVRFPTSLEKHGSDAMHHDPDYSCAYVILKVSNSEHEGHGLTFTIGRGTEIIVTAVRALEFLVVGKQLSEIFGDFAGFWRSLTSDSQLRWIGPEKGALHMATSAVVNALWDLWAKLEGKPLWKLLVDMTPEQLVSVIDFRYIEDALTKEEALKILKAKKASAAERESRIKSDGYPAYTTSVGWLGYGDDQLKKLCQEALAEGYTSFKAKVGVSIEDDRRRLSLIRKEIGQDNQLMVDANQRWDVNTSISWMKQLTDFNVLWIEEPTSPDDILGHATISQALRPLGIGVATGEQCQNRVIFKQLLQANAIQFCQIDACRLGGINEVLAVILLANKFKVPVCPHAGGVGLCEYVQHLAIWDYISVSGSLDKRMAEYVSHLHEHFKYPAKMSKGRYVVPSDAGYCGEMLPESMDHYEFPNGTYWSTK